MVINLKITFFVESYRARDDMGLSSDQVTAIQNDLTSTVSNAQDYLSGVEQAVINNTGVGATPDYVQFCNYYYIDVISYKNFIWNTDIQQYINPSDVFGCRIPVCA